MYLDFTVPIPDMPGKIGRFKKGNTVYIRYVTDRKYYADRKYNVPNHKIIGKAVADDPAQMIPNENFLKYFGDTDLPELKFLKAVENSPRTFEEIMAFLKAEE